MYRMLNIALVDVGAGTSDISITKDGAITAFGMIPMAGDSLTEAIARHCLVDFTSAEKIKRAVETEEMVTYTDIMGLPQTISREEVLAVAEPALNQMAKYVADKIKELNGDKPVSAVFVVGGGGKLAGYTEKLAEYLGIAKERVVLHCRRGLFTPGLPGVRLDVSGGQRPVCGLRPVTGSLESAGRSVYALRHRLRDHVLCNHQRPL